MNKSSNDRETLIRKRNLALHWLAIAVNRSNHGDGCACKSCKRAREILQQRIGDT